MSMVRITPKKVRLREQLARQVRRFVESGGVIQLLPSLAQIYIQRGQDRGRVPNSERAVAIYTNVGLWCGGPESVTGCSWIRPARPAY